MKIANFKLEIARSALQSGQSRQTLVTGNEGCVRYPT
jgi:hypothetical protein